MLLELSDAWDIFLGSESCAPHPLHTVGPVGTRVPQIGQDESWVPQCAQKAATLGNGLVHAGHVTSGTSELPILRSSFLGNA